MRTLRFALLGLLAVTSLPRVVFAQRDKPVIAVLPLNVFSIGVKSSGDFGATLTDMITTEIGKKPTLIVVERQQVQDILTKQKLLVSGRVPDEELQHAAKILGADYLVTGGATMTAKEVRFDLRLFDAETSQDLHFAKQRGNADDMLTLVDQVADEFTKDLKVPSKAASIAAETHGEASSVAAILAYSRGLDFEKRGKRTEAAQQFEKSLQLSPNFDDAQKALARVK